MTAEQQIDWQRVLGPCASGWAAAEVAALDAAIQTHPDRCVRLRESQLPAPFPTEEVPWHARGRFLTEDTLPSSYLNFAAGDYYTQDAGSLLALALCDIQGNERVLDTCAAPGGKSTGILENLGTDGFLVANEVIASRLPLLRLACERAGVNNYLLFQKEVEQLQPIFGATFDCVLVDAPCSGQSMIVRGKQSLSAFSEAQIEHNVARQKKILAAAAGLVKPGGRIVYSTCTFSYAENEHIIQDFLDTTDAGWTLAPHPSLQPWESETLPGSYRLWPHRDRCSGAFAAAMLKAGSDTSEQSSPPVTSTRSANHKKKRASRSEKAQRWSQQDNDSLVAELSFLHMPPEDKAAPASFELWLYQQAKDLAQLLCIPSQTPLAWLEHCVAGPTIATQKNKRWEPTYGSARLESTGIQPSTFLELTDAGAAKYVAGEEFRLQESFTLSSTQFPLPAANAGWAVAIWQSRPLGWVKISSGSAKNHFPKPLRQSSLARRSS